MKRTHFISLLILAFALNNFSQVRKENTNSSLENAKIKITLLDLPGTNLEKSKWELAYEIRIITDKELFAAMTNGKLDLDADHKIGEFVAKNSIVKTSLANKENREVILTIPLDQKIRAKLVADLENLTQFNAVKDKVTPELLSARQMKTQSFIMYGNILVYDAKLKKNIIVSFDWVLPFTRFSHLPGVNFEMTFEIKEDGDFSKKVVLPARTGNSKTITVKQ